MNLGFIGGNINPCLSVKKNAKGVVYIVLYIDDNFMVRDMVAIDDAFSAIKRNDWYLRSWKG